MEEAKRDDSKATSVASRRIALKTKKSKIL
jgi:hypothetical protein